MHPSRGQGAALGGALSIPEAREEESDDDPIRAPATSAAASTRSLLRAADEESMADLGDEGQGGRDEERVTAADA